MSGACCWGTAMRRRRGGDWNRNRQPLLIGLGLFWSRPCCMHGLLALKGVFHRRSVRQVGGALRSVGFDGPLGVPNFRAALVGRSVASGAAFSRMAVRALACGRRDTEGPVAEDLFGEYHFSFVNSVYLTHFRSFCFLATHLPPKTALLIYSHYKDGQGIRTPGAVQGGTPQAAR